MFVPTIRHRRANEPTENSSTLSTAVPASEPPCRPQNTATANKATVSSSDSSNAATSKHTIPLPCASQPKEPDERKPLASIKVDPQDNDSILITLSTGKQYSADRYCPHAGADLSVHGKIDEDGYPSEIGPIIMCPMHYWEFALEKQGRAGGGLASIHACPVANDKKMDW